MTAIQARGECEGSHYPHACAASGYFSRNLVDSIQSFWASVFGQRIQRSGSRRWALSHCRIVALRR